MIYFGKLTVASALFALSINSANALDVSVGGGVSASVGANSSGATGGAGLGTGASVGTNSAGVAAGAGVGTGASVGANLSGVVTGAEAVARGEATVATSSEGMIIGTINEVSTTADGRTEVSITVDPSLALNQERVTFRGQAEIDNEGQVVLPMTQVDFVNAVRAETSSTIN